MAYLKLIGGWIAAILVGFLLIWVIAGNTLIFQKVFNPQFEQVRRETFENSKAYRDGMVQELHSLQIEYIKADAAIKPALADVIKHKAVGIPADALPQDLTDFIKGL